MINTIKQDTYKLCECGCGQIIIPKPYHKYHKKEIRYIWGHNPIIHSKETKEKISKTRKDLIKNNKLKIWNTGLTKNIDKRLLLQGQKLSKALKGRLNVKLSETRKKLFKEGKLLRPLLIPEIKEKIRLAKIGKPRSEKTKEKISKGNKGKRRTEEQRKIYSISHKGLNCGEKHPLYGKHHSEETKKKMRKPHYSIRGENSPSKRLEVRKKLSESHKGILSFMYGKHHSLKTRKKMSEKAKKRMCDLEYKTKHIKATLKGLMKRPTSFEQKIIFLCSKYRLPFIYTGDGRILINFKNPDFINEKDKIVIEVFLSYFKIRDYGSIENYKEFCRKKYESAGWRVIFIDENDLNCKNWEEICLNKISQKFKIELK